ncbi:hypothetical protein OK016_08805 [Vibrio chagasii]|nr:hypothetical protein [Vibrio chagasii]
MVLVDDDCVDSSNQERRQVGSKESDSAQLKADALKLQLSESNGSR